MAARAVEVVGVVHHPGQGVGDAGDPGQGHGSASGVRSGDQAASTQWASAFMPVSALTRAGSDRVEVGS